MISIDGDLRMARELKSGVDGVGEASDGLVLGDAGGEE